MTAELKKPATLTFWTWVPDIQNEVNLFERKYPNIKVKVVNVGQGQPHYQKLRTALKSGKGLPDVVQMEYQFIPSFTITNSLLDLTPYLPDDFGSGFPEWVWNQVNSDGKVWGIPQDTGPMGMLYRKDLLAKAGIEPPTTWEEFAQAARTYHQKNPDSYLTNIPGNDAGEIIGLFWQAGARPFEVKDSKTLRIDLTDPAAKKVADFWTPLVQDGVISTDADFTDQWYQGLATGKYASWLTAAWGPVFLQGTAKKTAGKWRAAPLPQWEEGDQVSANWGGSTDAVIAKTPHPAAAAELARFINAEHEPALMFANRQFLFPASNAILGDSKFLGQKSDFYGGQQVNKEFAEISDTVRTDFQWSPIHEFVNSNGTETFGKALTSKQDLAQGLQAWQDAVVAYAGQQGFEVEK
jgi:multiple sugar transport system substrate-binding protein